MNRNGITRVATGVIVALGVLTLTQCKKDPVAPTKVASADVEIAATAATLPAVEGTTFTFPAAATSITPALDGKAFSLAFTNTAAAVPTATFTVPGSGTYTADTEFGSCRFTIKSVTGASLWPVGFQFVVNPCQVRAKTNGAPANGTPTAVQILLLFGIIPSNPAQGTVSINPTTGTVTINNVNTGTTVVITVSGSTGD